MSDTPARKRTWIPIAIGIVLLLVVIGIGTAIFGALWLRERMEVTEVTENAATRAFEAIRAKFPGQQPLLELHDGKPQYVGERVTRSAATTRLSTLRILAFDEKDGQLARFEIPFFLLRMKSGPISLGSYASGFDDRGVKLSVEDIERHGAGIVIDFARPREGRVLIWAE